MAGHEQGPGGPRQISGVQTVRETLLSGAACVDRCRPYSSASMPISANALGDPQCGSTACALCQLVGLRCSTHFGQSAETGGSTDHRICKPTAWTGRKNSTSATSAQPNLHRLLCLHRFAFVVTWHGVSDRTSFDEQFGHGDSCHTRFDCPITVSYRR